MKYVSIPHLQIRSDSVLLYYQLDPRPAISRHQFIRALAPTYSGNIRSHAQRRIMRAVDMLLQRNQNRIIWNPVISKHHDFRIAFVTLTIPDPSPVLASFAHKNLLEPFLRTARRKWGVTDYIWKAELQERGQLHYHITWSVFVEMTSIQNAWNNLLRKHGLSVMFAAKEGHFHAPSTHVHSVWKVNNLKAYLGKYIAKEEQNPTPLDGKIWDCSKTLKIAPYSVVAHDYHQRVIEDAIQHGMAKMKQYDHCSIYETKKPWRVLTGKELQDYHTHIA